MGKNNSKQFQRSTQRRTEKQRAKTVPDHDKPEVLQEGRIEALRRTITRRNSIPAVAKSNVETELDTILLLMFNTLEFEILKNKKAQRHWHQEGNNCPNHGGENEQSR